MESRRNLRYYHLIRIISGTEGLNICDTHRDELGWKWERPDKSCYHPDHATWSQDPEVRPYGMFQ
jgi:hypothetical protein